MRFENHPMDVPVVLNAEGAAVDVRSWGDNYALLAKGWASGSWSLEGSCDGTDFAAVPGPITIGASGLQKLTDLPVGWLRLKCAAAPTGAAPSVVVSGKSCRD